MRNLNFGNKTFIWGPKYIQSWVGSAGVVCYFGQDARELARLTMPSKVRGVSAGGVAGHPGTLDTGPCLEVATEGTEAISI